MKTYVIAPDGKSITCLHCLMRSYHPKDVRNLYCGCCHRYHDDGRSILPAEYLWQPQLLDAAKMLSPRLAWIKRYDIRTSKFEGEPIPEPWSAWVGNLDKAVDASQIAHGESELAALVALAAMRGVPMW